MAPLPGTFNLPGPSTLTYEYLLTLVSTITYNPPSRAPVVPKSVALSLSKLAQNVWWPMLSPDEVVRRYISDVEVPGDWEAFGVVPDEIEEHAITYLRRYRSACVLFPLSFPVLPCFSLAARLCFRISAPIVSCACIWQPVCTLGRQHRRQPIHT